MSLPAFITGLNPDGTAYLPRRSWAIYASHIETGGSRYMSRWVLHTPFGQLKLHHIHRPDADQHPHDHVADFWSFILSGGYSEEFWARIGTPTLPADVEEAMSLWVLFGPDSRSPRTQPGGWYSTVVPHEAGSVIRRGATDYHRIVAVLPNTWTLVWFGRKRKSWGFLTENGKIPWREYLGVGGAS